MEPPHGLFGPILTAAEQPLTFRLKPDNTAELLVHQDVLGVGWALFGLHG